MQTKAAQPNYRFRTVAFANRGGSRSWRVTGIGRDGKRVRQNFTSQESAKAKELELEADYLGRRGPAVLKDTSLSDGQLRLAEAAFLRLDQDEDMLPAIDQWVNGGKHNRVTSTKRLDEAVDEFCTWVGAAAFREQTQINLKSRVKIFRSLVGDLELARITPEVIDGFLAKRKVAPVTLDNDRRALSRFFRFCCDRPRRWMSYNPCREVHIQKAEPGEPGILTVEECGHLLKVAKDHKDGKLLGHIVLGLFGGLRPFESARLSWDKVNFADGEIRIDAAISKVKRSRVVPIDAALRAWLSLCHDKPFAPGDWDNELRQIRKKAEIEKWPADVLRHTALSQYFRLTESFGATAEWGGTSETIIKDHYKARVSTADCKRFWGLRP